MRLFVNFAMFIICFKNLLPKNFYVGVCLCVHAWATELPA